MWFKWSELLGMVYCLCVIRRDRVPGGRFAAVFQRRDFPVKHSERRGFGWEDEPEGAEKAAQ